MFDKNKNQNFAKEVEKITATDKSNEALEKITRELVMSYSQREQLANILKIIDEYYKVTESLKDGD